MVANSLGRIFVAGNGGVHTVKLVNASDGSDVVGASVTVTLGGGTAGQFSYAPLASPVRCRPTRRITWSARRWRGGPVVQLRDSVDNVGWGGEQRGVFDRQGRNWVSISGGRIHLMCRPISSNNR